MSFVHVLIYYAEQDGEVEVCGVFSSRKKAAAYKASIIGDMGCADEDLVIKQTKVDRITPYWD